MAREATPALLPYGYVDKKFFLEKAEDRYDKLAGAMSEG
jgi:hypothetical protein